MQSDWIGSGSLGHRWVENYVYRYQGDPGLQDQSRRAPGWGAEEPGAALPRNLEAAEQAPPREQQPETEGPETPGVAGVKSWSLLSTTMAAKGVQAQKLRAFLGKPTSSSFPAFHPGCKPIGWPHPPSDWAFPLVRWLECQSSLDTPMATGKASPFKALLIRPGQWSLIMDTQRCRSYQGQQRNEQTRAQACTHPQGVNVLFSVFGSERRAERCGGGLDPAVTAELSPHCALQ